MKFTRFFPSPTPFPTEPQKWVKDAAGVIEDNFLAVARSVDSIGQDLESPKDEYMTLTAGEDLVAGDLAALKSGGKMWKADASALATSHGLLGIVSETIAADKTGKFLIRGTYNTTGLTVGVPYYITTTAGTYSYIPPTTSTNVIRVIGYSLSSTELFLQPAGLWTVVP